MHLPTEKASRLSCNVDHQYPTRIPGRVAFRQLTLAVFPFLAVTPESLAEETEAMKRLMGSSDKSVEIASVCIVRVSYTYQNDSLHPRKKTTDFWSFM